MCSSIHARIVLAIKIRHHVIPSRLQRYFQRAMIIDYRAALGTSWHVVPSGHFGLVVLLGDDDGDDRLDTSRFECWFTGLMPRAVGTWCDRPCVVLALTLTPLAAVHLALEANDFSSEMTVRQERLVGPAAMSKLRNRMRSARSLAARILAVLEWTESLILDRHPASARRIAIAEAAMLMHSREALGIVDAAARVGVTRRQFERDFGRHLGTSPKRLAQVAKVQQFAQLAWHGRGLAEIAAELGFADQSHMNHTVREIAGMSPTVMLQRAAESEFTRATRPFWNGRITLL